MRLLLLGLCAFGASLSQASAQAPVAAAFDWSGYYIGLDAGTTQGHSEITIIRPRSAVFDTDANTYGLHGGYRVQLENNLVLGWELAISKQEQDASFEFFAGSSTQGAQLKYEWDGSLRTTFGWAFGRALFYGLGGLSVLQADSCGFVVTRPGRLRRGSFIPCIPGSEIEEVRFGWIAGAGFAHAIGDRVSLRVEYLYADYGNQRFVTPASVTDFTDVKIRTQSVRAGFSVLLGGGSNRNEAASPLFDWSGAYLGVQGALLRARSQFQFPGAGTATDDADLSGGGFGATAGYNWQTGNLVLGLEGDVVLPDAKSFTYCPNAAFICATELKSLATVRARAGFARGNVLLYLSAGVAVADLNAEAVFRGNGAAVGILDDFVSGLTAGVGAEWRLHERWSAKAEYHYLDFGTIRVPQAGTDIRIAGHLWRLGLNWHF